MINTQEYALLEKFRSIGPRDEIQVLGLTELIRDARTVHVEAIRSLEKDLDEDGADDGDDDVTDDVAAPRSTTTTGTATVGLDRPVMVIESSKSHLDNETEAAV